MEQVTLTKPVPTIHIDINSQRNFVKYFNKLGEKPITTVRFFDRTDCFTVHGKDDTELLSSLLYKSTSYIRLMLDGEIDELPYLALTKQSFEQAVRELLLVRNYRVEVYVRRSTASDWKVEYRGSPGNLTQFEDILFSNKDMIVGNSLISLFVHQEGGANAQRKLGIAVVEQNDCNFMVIEYLDDDFYTELEATVVLLGPQECLLPSVDGEYAGVRTLMERNGVMVTTAKKSPVEEKGDIIQDLNRLLRFGKGQQEDASALPETSYNLAMSALKAAIKYLNLLNDNANLGHYTIKQLNLNRFVHLDAAAVSALNIFPKTGQGSLSRFQSILGVLDHCRTPQGHRLMAQWVKQPLRNAQILNDRHNVVQCLLEAPSTLTDLHEDYLKRIPDVLMLTKKLMRRKAHLQDLFRVYQVILRIPKVIKILQSLDNTTISNVVCESLRNNLTDLTGLKQMVEQVIDFDSIEDGEYLVKASFNEQLQELKSNMARLQEKMERLRQKVNGDLHLDSLVRLENVSHLGYHFRIALKDDSVLRKSKDYRVVDVVKGGVRFTSDKLLNYSQQFSELREQYEIQQKSIVAEIVQVAVGYAAPLTLLNNEIAQLDCLVSLAVAAQTAPTQYKRPKMLPEGSGALVLKDIRHPCVELQENVTFIANDVEFQKDFCNMIIITGPNMGGKSTYIRSVGTSVLMAHIGSFVPCSSATISMVDSILGRVGASDNIMKGLSTFMVEMIETSGIIRTATENSLVIIDELGRGTSTYEGCGIAWSIAEHLAKQTKCFTLFATHFHEITNLSEYVPTVKNFHMAAVADNENFALLFQVRPGVMEKSFGIQVARLANFPDEVVKNAENFYNELEDEHLEKQSEEDKELLSKISNAIEQLSTTGNSLDINEHELKKLVDQFKHNIKELDSEYFRAVASKVT